MFLFSSMTLIHAQGKVDVESLGLDDVSMPKLPVIPLPTEEKKTKAKLPDKLPLVPINNILDIKEIKKEEVKQEEKQQKEIKKEEIKEVEVQEQKVIETPKIELIQPPKEEVKKEAPEAPVVGMIKTKSGKIMEALKAVIVEEKQEEHPAEEIIKTPEELEVEEHERKRMEDLEQLRQQYLIKKGEEKNHVFGEEIILPTRKIINPFISEEIPAPPILGSYRTRENTHIPVFPSLDQRISQLFDTVSYGDVALFNSAYQEIQHPNIKNELGDTLLTYSLLRQKHAITASLIAKGADTNMPNNLGYTPLDIAIELRDLKSFELLVNNKANVFFTDRFGRTYLFHAARLGFLTAVEILVRKGVDVNVLDKDGFSALDIAYRNKQELVVQYLLKNGAKTWNEKPFDPTNSSLIKKLETRWDEMQNPNYQQNPQY